MPEDIKQIYLNIMSGETNMVIFTTSLRRLKYWKNIGENAKELQTANNSDIKKYDAKESVRGQWDVLIHRLEQSLIPGSKFIGSPGYGNWKVVEYHT